MNSQVLSAPVSHHQQQENRQFHQPVERRPTPAISSRLPHVRSSAHDTVVRHARILGIVD